MRVTIPPCTRKLPGPEPYTTVDLVSVGYEADVPPIEAEAWRKARRENQQADLAEQEAAYRRRRWLGHHASTQRQGGSASRGARSDSQPGAQVAPISDKASGGVQDSPTEPPAEEPPAPSTPGGLTRTDSRIPPGMAPGAPNPDAAATGSGGSAIVCQRGSTRRDPGAAPTDQQRAYLKVLRAHMGRATGEPVNAADPETLEEAMKLIDDLQKAIKELPPGHRVPEWKQGGELAAKDRLCGRGDAHTPRKPGRITAKEHDWSICRFGAPLCREHQEEARRQGGHSP